MSITRLECDVNPNFTFPAYPRSQFPPASSAESYKYPRRGSVPLNVASPLAPAANPRPKSSSATLSLTDSVTPGSPGGLSASDNGVLGPVSPGESNSGRSKAPLTPFYSGALRPGARTVGNATVPTVLSASVAPTVPTPGKGTLHARRSSEFPGTLEPKQENGYPVSSPQKAASPAGSPAGANAYSRRGHAHRRSGAISSGDVWSLLNQSAPALPLPSNGGNTDGKDATPSGRLSPGLALPMSTSAGSSPDLSWSAPVTPGAAGPSSSQPTTPAMSVDSAHSQRKNRVAFMEQVEVIPRPMSSESVTSDSMSMTGAGHIGNDSISSIVNLPVLPAPEEGATSRTPSPTRRRTRSNSQTMLQPTSALRATTDRPSTAGAILNSPVLSQQEEEVAANLASLKQFAPPSPASSEGPVSVPSSPTKAPTPKRTHKKALSDCSPRIASGPFSNSSNDLLSAYSADNCASHSAPETETAPMGKKDKKKKKKKAKKVKNWAGTILEKGRGLKHSSKRPKITKRAPTPPLDHSDNVEQGLESEWVAAAWNDSYVLMPVDASPIFNSSLEDIAGTASPVIDLDAALGPFKTPIGPSTGFAAARRRRMHSAAGAKGFGVFGFHRRSESMPEMQLFSLEEDDDGYMDDVFEEEEEDEDEEESSEEEDEEEEGKINGGDGLEIGIKIVDEDIPADLPVTDELEWTEDELSSGKNPKQVCNEDLKRHSLATASPFRPYHPADVAAPPSNIEEATVSTNGNAKGVPSEIVITSAHSSTSTVTPRDLDHFSVSNPPDSPMTFITASSAPHTPIQPEFSLDEYTDSAASFNPYTQYLGEPGPEMRMSVDDVPSLTSSASTMTMSAAYHNMPSTPSSQLTVPEKKKKDKKEKSKRWSKIWSFWKSK
ncbi:hypothetical protein RUND412_006412 [Rhizina undulata]